MRSLDRERGERNSELEFLKRPVMGMEVDDDVFFAELSKQIALLIMDDDEEFPAQQPPSVPLQSFHCVPQAAMPPPLAYELASRRESKGTGVFIPRSSCPRRKNRSGRSALINGGSQRQTDRSGVLDSHSTTANSRLYSDSYYYNSAMPKRHP